MWSDIFCYSFFPKIIQDPWCKLCTSFNSNTSRFSVKQIVIKFQTTQGISIERDLPALFNSNIIGSIIKKLENLIRRKSRCIGWIKSLTRSLKLFAFSSSNCIIKGKQNSRNRQLTATINSYINQIFSIKFEIQPRTTIRNNSGSKQKLSRRMGFTLIMIKKHSGRPVHL